MESSKLCNFHLHTPFDHWAVFNWLEEEFGVWALIVLSIPETKTPVKIVKRDILRCKMGHFEIVITWDMSFTSYHFSNTNYVLF